MEWAARTHSIWDWLGPAVGKDALEKRKSLATAGKWTPIPRSSRYSLVTVPNKLCRLYACTNRAQNYLRAVFSLKFFFSWSNVMYVIILYSLDTEKFKSDSWNPMLLYHWTDVRHMCNYFLLGLALIYFLQTSSHSTLSADIVNTTPPYISPLYKATYISDTADDWQLILDKSWTLVHTLTYLLLGSHWTMSGAVWRHRKFLSTDVLLVIEYTCNTNLSAGKFFTFRQTPTRFNWVSFFGYRQNGREIIPGGLELLCLPPCSSMTLKLT